MSEEIKPVCGIDVESLLKDLEGTRPTTAKLLRRVITVLWNEVNKKRPTDDITVLSKRVEDAEGLLKKVEWKGHSFDETVCPICDAIEFSFGDSEHRKDCALSAFLKGGD